MRAKYWKLLVNATDGMNEKWLQMKQKEIDLDKDSTWYYDQWITTHGILKHKICQVPAYSGLWNNKGLIHDPAFDDSSQCWHGFGYKDCNIEMHIVPHGCKWYHFFPSQNFQAHVDKFNEITKNEYNLSLKDMYSDNER